MDDNQLVKKRGTQIKRTIYHCDQERGGEELLLALHRVATHFHFKGPDGSPPGRRRVQEATIFQ